MRLLPIHSQSIKKRLKSIAAIFIITLAFLLVAALTAIFAIQQKFADKIYPGVFINALPAQGLTKERAKTLIEIYANNLDSEGINFLYGNYSVAVTSTYTALFDPDINYTIAKIDTDRIVEDAYLAGREGNIFNQWRERLQNFRRHKIIPLNYTINKEALSQILKENFKAFEEAPKDAKFSVTEKGEVKITEESYGLVFDYEKAISDFEDIIRNMSLDDIEILQIIADPSVKKSEIEPLSSLFKTISNAHTSLTVAYENASHKISLAVYQEWITSRKEGGKVTLAFDIQKVKAYIEKEIAPKARVPVQEARFEIENGMVKEFKPSANGIEVDAEKTASDIAENLFINNADATSLIVSVTKPQFTLEKANTLGIKEILGTGHSNFKGSPKNRRHNIANGAKAINGILIQPESEFSLLAALGEISAETGYLPELVIKGNKTIPEYGGGLCQLGTTVFRATLESGLPVTERQNHSYQVPYYYENGVSGTDATIYNPKPDYKFANDTNNYVLIQSRIEGDDFYVDFWGTKDGRLAKRTIPQIYNLKPPPTAKYVETADLKPGEKKCTERAHTGADAKFTYTVAYPDKTIKETEFKSHYRPWQAVCLVGVKAEEESQKTEESAAEATPITP